MDKSFWLNKWQNQELAFHQADVNPYLLQFWPQLALAADTQVLVPLCGKSLDMVWLAQQGHSVLGVELSPLAVEDFFASLGLAPEIAEGESLLRYQADAWTLLQGDFFALPPVEVGAVFDRAALVALPADMRVRYVEHLLAVIPRSAPILLVVFEYEQQVMAGPPFSVSSDEIFQLFAPHRSVTLLTQADVLSTYPSFEARGLNALVEKVYWIA